MSTLATLPAGEKTLWKEFVAGLASIFVMALGQGAFLLLMVAFLEHRQVPVAENGAIKAFLSLVEGAVCLGAGFIYHGKYARRIMAASLMLMAAGSFVYALQSLTALIWLGTALNGVGIGVMIVILYVATLERRPSTLHLGLATGLYTACIAGGNALGEALSGIITDHFGFGVSFGYAGVAMLAVIGLVALMGPQVNPALQKQAAAPEESGPSKGATLHPLTAEPWVWKLAIVAGFVMSGVNAVFDTLFPIYALRAGLTFTAVGSLAGLKMLLAAIIRPFSGAIMARLDAVRLNNGSLVTLVAATVITPLAGIGAGLTGLVCLMGLAFGTVRVTTATLALYGQNDPHLTSQRSSIYNTILSAGQIVGPWASGLVAETLGLAVALTTLPAMFLVLYLIGQTFLLRSKSKLGLAA